VCECVLARKGDGGRERGRARERSVGETVGGSGGVAEVGRGRVER